LRWVERKEDWPGPKQKSNHETITPMKQAVPTSPTPKTSEPGLTLVIRSEDDGVLLAREAVREEDFTEAKTEAFRELFLRQGILEVSLADLPVRLRAIPVKDGPPNRCRGYAFEKTVSAGSGKKRTVFTMNSLERVATRVGNRLLESGALESGEDFVFELESGAPTAQAAPDPFADILGPTIRKSEMHFLQAELSPLLQNARSVNEADPDVFPVFYTEEAVQQAEAHSRKGSPADPNYESGAILAGPICSCPVSGEFFIVVCKVQEVTEADQTLVSLEYSGESWARIQKNIRKEQTENPAIRILGQAHGHNFLPNNGETCADCPTKPVCDVDNLFVSSDDKNWTRAVFSQQPWQLCHIFGLTARNDRINALFSLHDARLIRRGYHIIPDFDATAHPTISVLQ
tara:strand:+ start:1940 stop:3145 length:1206 start_codon:yes stop_codon:yes gene_type:complete